MVTPSAELGPIDATVRSLAGNTPMALDDPGVAWVVQSGEVAVFCVERDAESTAGPRHYLFTMGVGGILFGSQPVSSGRPVSLLAVGLTGTTVRRVTLAGLRERSSDPVAATQVLDGVEAWVQGMCQTRSGQAYQRPTANLNPGASPSLTSGQTAGPADGVVWVSAVRGNAHYLDSTIAFAPPPGVDLPIGEPAWIAAEGNCQITVSELQPDPKDEATWHGLDAFNQIALAHEQQLLDALTARDLSRLRREATHERDRRDTALALLAGVLEAGQAARPEAADDPLFAACQLVADATGISLHNPPEIEGAPPSSDPIATIANASRIRIRRVTLAGEWWRQEAGPMLAFLNADEPRPVALLPARGRSYTLVDPQTKAARRLDRSLNTQLLTEAFVFYRPFPERAVGVWEMLRFALRGMRPDLLRIVLLGAVVGVLATFTPIATGVIFGDIIPAGDHQRIIAIAIALAGAALGSSLFEIARSLAVLRVEARLDSSLQSAVWDRLLKLPAPFFRHYSAGDLASRAMGIDQMRQILGGAAISTILSAVFSLFSLVLMFYYSAALALVGVVLTLMTLAALVVSQAVQLRSMRSITTLQGKIAGSLLQFITGIAKLRVAAAEARAFSIWANSFAEQKRAFFRAQNAANLLATFFAVWPLLTSLVIFAVVASLPQGSLSTAAYLAFVAAFTGQLLTSVLTLGQAATSVLQCVPLYERSRPILRTLPEVMAHKADPGVLTGAIEISHVTFRYQVDGPLVLRDVSMRIEPGELAAIVGPSGAGKSSILRLLLGFETPESGSVYYDGRDVDGLDAAAVRRQIGVVLQDARLMPGSIYDNIVGAQSLKMDDAWEAARMAGLEDDIRRMPMQMQTYISEGGATFSGGQRQRLMIARALAGRPRILLFDEATSALDNVTQAIVIESMAKLRATRLVIAHRLSTVQEADRIFVLVAGRVAQTGSFQELMAQPGPFAGLARRQLV